MKLFTKVAIGLLLGFGMPITLLAVVKLRDPNTLPQDREEAKAALVIFGLAPSTMGLSALYSAKRHSQKQQIDHLQTSFFRLLRQNDGRITSLQFAMATKLDGRAAKAYLDERALEFDADYDISPDGNIAYWFELGSGLGSRWGSNRLGT